MKKRVIGAFLAVVMVIGLVGCGNKEGNDSSSNGSESSGESSNMIAYTQKTLNQYFHVALQEKVEEAVSEAGYVPEVANCNNDSTLQNDQMKNFITKKPKAIIVNTVDSDALNDATNAATNAGIPIVMVDNPASTAVVDCTIQFDNFECGEMAAEEILAKLKEKNGSETGRVVNVYGAMSSESWRLRKDGFDSVMKEYPDIDYVQVPGEGERGKSQEALTNVIAKYNGDIDAVHCPSDDPGLGCAEALQVAGLWYPVDDEKHVIMVTGDGEPDAVKYLQDGYYDAIVVEDAYAYGPMAMDVLSSYIFEGKEVPTTGTYTNEKFYWKTAEFMSGETGPILRVPPYVLDASNIEDEGHWGVQALKAEGE